MEAVAIEIVWLAVAVRVQIGVGVVAFRDGPSNRQPAVGKVDQFPWLVDGRLGPDAGLAEMVPAIDVRDAGDAYVVEVEMPGVNPDDTEVMIEGRTLTIRGRFAEEREQDEGNVLLRERRRGQFMRAVALPGMVEVDQVTSKYEDGELIITLPKAEQNRARRVQIQATHKPEAQQAGGAQQAGAGGAQQAGAAEQTGGAQQAGAAEQTGAAQQAGGSQQPG